MHAPENVYLAVRTGFVAQGTSLYRWCKENGVSRQVAEKALKFARNGKKSIALRERLITASGVR
jgi:hypothetical protein